MERATLMLHRIVEGGGDQLRDHFIECYDCRYIRPKDQPQWKSNIDSDDFVLH